MNKKDIEINLIEWLKSKPELLEKLEQMRKLEEGDEDLDKVELEMLELVKGMGADSIGRLLEEKNNQATEKHRCESAGRIHGKKNSFSPVC